MKNFIWISFAFALVLLTACDSSEKRLSSTQFGSAWPFEMESGTIKCLGNPFVIIFTTDGRTYALNDAARATEQYEDISVIVKIDDNYPGGQVKMDLSVIEFEGLKLCNHRDE